VLLVAETLEGFPALLQIALPLLFVFLHITVCPATVALNDLFAFLNILYCPRL
jgi:hypothetical protein